MSDFMGRQCGECGNVYYGDHLVCTARLKWLPSEAKIAIKTLEADRDSETRWAAEYHAKWQAAQSRLSALEAENKRLMSEVGTLIWNLAGCSTFALGYGLDQPFDEKSARPAMFDVLKLAKRERRFREALERIDHELGRPEPGYPAPVANASAIAQSALAGEEGK